MDLYGKKVMPKDQNFGKIDGQRNPTHRKVTRAAFQIYNLSYHHHCISLRKRTPKLVLLQFNVKQLVEIEV